MNQQSTPTRFRSWSHRPMPSMLPLLLLAATCFVISGCNASAPPPGTSSQKPTEIVIPKPNTPTEAVAQFHDVLQADMVNVAVFSLDDIEYGTPAAKMIRQNIELLAKRMTRGGYDFKAVASKTDQEAAVVLIEELPAIAGKPVYRPIFLIKRKGTWKIAPSIYTYDKFLGLSRQQAQQYSGLDRWFQLKRADLKVHPPKP